MAGLNRQSEICLPSECKLLQHANIFSHLVFEGAKSGRGLAALSGGKSGGGAEDGSEDGRLHHGGILAWIGILTQSEGRCRDAKATLQHVGGLNFKKLQWDRIHILRVSFGLPSVLRQFDR